MLGLMFIAFIGTGAFGVHLAREQYKSLDDDTSVNFGFISICLGCLIAVSLAVNCNDDFRQW
jgi:hypothetical protein